MFKRRTGGPNRTGRVKPSIARPVIVAQTSGAPIGSCGALALVVVLFLLTRMWMLWAFEPRMSDLFHFGVLAREGVDLKKVPYKEIDVEYPPLAWWLIASPRYIDPQAYPGESPPPRVMERYFRWYHGWFRFELFLADTICLALMFAIGRRVSAAAAWALPAAYALLTAMQPHLIYDRLDVALLMFFLLQIACWLRSLDPSPSANRWAAASYLFLGLGISFKIMPVVFAPFLLLADLRAAAGLGALAGRVAALLLGTLVPFAVDFASAGWDVFKIFEYHSARAGPIWEACGAASCSWPPDSASPANRTFRTSAGT